MNINPNYFSISRMLDLYGNLIASGYYCEHHEMDTNIPYYYFRPSDGRYDITINGTLYYGFARCEKIDNITVINISPYFEFTTQLTGTNVIVYANSSNISTPPSEITSLSMYSEADSIYSVLTIAYDIIFKIATIGNAGALGEISVQENDVEKCIVKSQLSDYNVQLQQYCQPYANNLCVKRYDIKKIPTQQSEPEPDPTVSNINYFPVDGENVYFKLNLNLDTDLSGFGHDHRGIDLGDFGIDVVTNGSSVLCNNRVGRYGSSTSMELTKNILYNSGSSRIDIKAENLWFYLWTYSTTVHPVCCEDVLVLALFDDYDPIMILDTYVPSTPVEEGGGCSLDISIPIDKIVNAYILKQKLHMGSYAVVSDGTQQAPYTINLGLYWYTPVAWVKGLNDPSYAYSHEINEPDTAEFAEFWKNYKYSSNF